MVLQAVACPRPELVELPARPGHADDRHVEVAALQHRLQRWEDLLVSQVARDAEEDQGVRMCCAHGVLSFSSLLGGFLQVSTEAETHGRQQFVLVVRLSAR